MKWSLALSDKGSKPMSSYPPGLPNGPPDPIDPSERDVDRAIETVLERIAESNERANELLAHPLVRQLAIEIDWEEIMETAHELATAPPDVDEDLPHDEHNHHATTTNGG